MEELSVRCGTKWGKMRSEAETRTKVAKKDKADKLIRKTITKNVMATFTAGGLTVPLTPGNATAAGAKPLLVRRGAQRQQLPFRLQSLASNKCADGPLPFAL